MKFMSYLAGLATLLTCAVALSTVPGSAPATKPAAGEGGYLFVTFKGEQTPMTEQIYFGLSQDGTQWSALNNGDPVLVSTVGEKGVRDPYILRSHDNKKFFIVATDLCINLNRDWQRAVRSGSKSVVIWESEDLVKWSEPRLVKVAPDDAGCTWAPEAIYDEEAKDYMLYWASSSERDGARKQRIWAAHTKDFKEFSKPEIYIESTRNIIDTDIIRDGGKYYRFSKDGFVTMQVADKLAGPWKNVEGYSMTATQGYEGPTAFQMKPAIGDKPATWCVLLDFYTRGEGYKPFVTENLATGKFTANDNIKFPFRFRHGSVLAVTADEYARLKSALERPARN